MSKGLLIGDRIFMPLFEAVFKTLGKQKQLKFVEANRASMGYRRYGLKYEDTMVATPEVKEAVRRLPKAVRAARDQRVLVAFQLSARNEFLPEDKWTKPEDDTLYLAPYLKEVESEQRARSEWFHNFDDKLVANLNSKV
eukprot:TRINITY_DN950_c0_g1_i1.p1 TRINITY_DN950_c0_g1~~TRINITY_DN950_c0_g1_i1.p1  ORF type:complete len:160 (-),score=68.85 TRINITY_DN950_c0_g1_i1:182-598(-)